MNVAFVIPPSPDHRRIIRLIDCSHEAKGDYLWQPNDFLVISSLLSEEDHAALVDGTAERLAEEAFFSRVAELEADLICFALSSVCWQNDYRLFLKTRELHPAAALYVIGDVFLEEDYRAFILGQCDGVIVNPYLLDLKGMARRRRALPGVRTSAEEPYEREEDVLPATGGIPRHRLFQNRGYLFPFARHLRHATVTTLWGCPFACSYCPDSLFSPVVRPTEAVLSELKYLEDLGIRELFFADKVFGYPADNALALLQEMARSFDFSWSCYFHPQLYREELLTLMKSAGCHTIIVGIESADLEGLHRYGRKVDEGKVWALIEQANRLKIDVCADFILGLGHESEADIRRTIALALELPVDFASFNIAAPFPGTDIRKKARQAGKMPFGTDGFDSLAHGEDLGLSEVPHEVIRRLRDRALRRFYLRPSYLLKRLRRTVSIEHLLVQLRQMLGMFKKG